MVSQWKRIHGYCLRMYLPKTIFFLYECKGISFSTNLEGQRIYMLGNMEQKKGRNANINFQHNKFEQTSTRLL